jgi:hypothetical protein
MPRVTCRCGEKLTVQISSPERINCPKCGAKIRLRRATSQLPEGEPSDGFLRFLCPCGRRLKVSAIDRPVAGKCPDCGRVVPVPTSAQAHVTVPRFSTNTDTEARTEELDATDLAVLKEWTAHHADDPIRSEAPISTTTDVQSLLSNIEAEAEVGFVAPVPPQASAVKFEAGLRICPRCKKPVHLGAATCRECGTPVPRQ